LPANLPPEALAKQRKYQEAKTLTEKIRALEEYIAAIPKHKGTEKLLMQLKRKLAKLKAELESSSKRSGVGGVSFHVKKEGAGQIVLVGLTCVGKSELLNVLTGKSVEVGDYPFTTKRPEPGVTYYEDVPIQIVEVPALFEGASRGSRLGSQILSVIRNADVVALVLTADINHQMRTLIEELKSGKIYLNMRPPPVEVEKTPGGGINIIGSSYLRDCSVEDVVSLLRDHGVYNAIVKIFGPVKLEDFTIVLEGGITYKPALIVATKGDLPGTSSNFEKLVKEFGSVFKVVPVSSKKRKGIDALKRTFFEMLDVVRVYTRDPSPSQGVSEKPIILKKPATVADVAKRIHRRFIKDFKFARVWRKSEKVEVLKVGLDFELRDLDIIQIYTS